MDSRFKDAQLLKGKKAVVTGAGFGIGRQIAYTLAEQGASVIVMDYNEETAKEADIELENVPDDQDTDSESDDPESE